MSVTSMRASIFGDISPGASRWSAIVLVPPLAALGGPRRFVRFLRVGGRAGSVRASVQARTGKPPRGRGPSVRLAESREVHHWAANEDGGRDEGAEAGTGGGGDVVVLRQGRRRQAGFPGEDLEIPGAPGVPLLARDEVQHVAVGRVGRKHRGVLG